MIARHFSVTTAALICIAILVAWSVRAILTPYGSPFCSGTVQVDVQATEQGGFLADTGFTGCKFWFYQPVQEGPVVTPQKAVFVTKVNERTGFVLSARLHHVICECEHCGEFVGYPSESGMIECLNCDSQLAYSLKPVGAQEFQELLVSTQK
jgi:hypothetical protein